MDWSGRSNSSQKKRDEQSILQIIGLCKSFGEVQAADEVGFTIHAGDLTAIIGPNGAGKTTLFNLITGYLQPNSGRVLFEGMEITGLPVRDICRRGIGRSFQVAEVFPRLSVFDSLQVALLSKHKRHLNLFAGVKDLFREEVLSLLEMMGLSQNAHNLCAALARGDQKKLDITMALAIGSRILILDEPVAGSSPEETLQITSLLSKLVNQFGMTIVFSEHDLDVVFGIATTIIVMHEGRIIACDTPQEIRKNRKVQKVYLGEFTDA